MDENKQIEEIIEEYDGDILVSRKITKKIYMPDIKKSIRDTKNRG